MIPPGIHPDFDPKVYHAWSPDPVRSTSQELLAGPVSASMLKAFAVNPALWKSGRIKSPTRSMNQGSLIDCILLTPDRFDDTFAVRPEEFRDYKTDAAKAWRDEAFLDGQTPVTIGDYSRARNAVTKLWTHPDTASIFREGLPQVALSDHYLDTAVKALVDFIPASRAYRDAIVDLKSVDCAPEQFTLNKCLNQVAEFGYHISAAWYLQLYANLAGSDERTRFVMVFVCQHPPFPHAVIELAKQDVESGADVARNAIEHYVRCCTEDRWRSPMEGRVHVLSRPVWAFARDEELIFGLQS